MNWRRDRYEWESNLETDLLSILSTGSMCKEALDHLLWRGDPKGMFSVKSAYSILAIHQQLDIREGVFCSLWQAKAMPKVLATAWRVLLDRIPTRVNLIRRGVLVNSPLYALCNMLVESSQHLFLDCIFA